MGRKLAVLAVVICAAGLGGPLMARADQPEDPTKFESDPMLGGQKNVILKFILTPKWDRIRKLIMSGQEDKAAELAEWIEWAKSLQPKSPTDRLLAINRRVNDKFTYDTDDDIWGEDDYWADPREAVRKKRLDCEDF